MVRVRSLEQSAGCNSIYVVVGFNDRIRYRKPIGGRFCRSITNSAGASVTSNYESSRGLAAASRRRRRLPRLTNDWHQLLAHLSPRGPPRCLTNYGPLSLFKRHRLSARTCTWEVLVRVLVQYILAISKPCYWYRRYYKILLDTTLICLNKYLRKTTK